MKITVEFESLEEFNSFNNQPPKAPAVPPAPQSPPVEESVPSEAAVSAPLPWQNVVVHFGKHNNKQLGQLQANDLKYYFSRQENPQYPWTEQDRTLNLAAKEGYEALTGETIDDIPF